MFFADVLGVFWGCFWNAIVINFSTHFYICFNIFDICDNFDIFVIFDNFDNFDIFDNYD